LVVIVNVTLLQGTSAMGFMQEKPSLLHHNQIINSSIIINIIVNGRNHSYEADELDLTDAYVSTLVVVAEDEATAHGEQAEPGALGYQQIDRRPLKIDRLQYFPALPRNDEDAADGAAK